MKVMKKNQVIVFVIALMLMSAGYLNYTATQDADSVSTSAVDANTVSIQYAGIGDAKLVSSSEVIENRMLNEQVNAQTVETNANKSEIVENANDAVTIARKDIEQTEEYFTSSKLGRDTMYSQMIETYQKVLENEGISAEQKAIAQTEIKKINEIKNAIMIAENLIKNKGIDNVIIFVNDPSINVIVKAEALSTDQIAQIQNIIARELKTQIDNIHISSK